MNGFVYCIERCVLDSRNKSFSLTELLIRPVGIEFREDLPKTLVGKVAYRVLEEEAAKESAT